MELFVLLIAVAISYLIGWYFGQQRLRNDLGIRADQVLRYAESYRAVGDLHAVVTAYREYIDTVRMRGMPRYLQGPDDLLERRE